MTTAKNMTRKSSVGSKAKTDKTGFGTTAINEHFAEAGNKVSGRNRGDIPDKRERVLEVTSRLIVDKGIHGVPTSLIARESGIAVGTLYTYFKTKQELVHAVYENLLNSMTHAVSSAYSSDGSVQDRFFSLYSAIIDYLIENPQQSRLLLYLTTTLSLKESFREKTSRQLVRMQEDVLVDGQKQGLIKDEPPFVVRWITYGSLILLVNRERSRKELVSDPARRRRIVQMCWDCVRQ